VLQIQCFFGSLDWYSKRKVRLPASEELFSGIYVASEQENPEAILHGVYGADTGENNENIMVQYINHL
jgi:hypothetical protein